MSINNEILQALIECDYKGYLKYSGLVDEKKDFERYFEDRKLKYKQEFINKFQTQKVNGNFNIKDYSTDNIICDVSFLVDKLDILCDFVKIDVDKSDKSLIAVPILIFARERLSIQNKLYTSYIISNLNKGVSNISNYAICIFGSKLKQTKVYAKEHKAEHNRLLGKIDEIEKLELFRNKNCSECGYNQHCLKIAKEQDMLCLVSGITKNDIKKKREKGIFTLTQMSYTFRPRRNRKKKQAIQKKRKIELQALTLREGKVHIYEYPDLVTNTFELYVDIEGLPDENYYYLIGVVIKHKTKIEYVCFWADNPNEESDIFEKFIDFTLRFEKFSMFHYGQYEIRAFNKLKTSLSSERNKQLEKIFSNSVDILATINASVYFPIYNYSLKEVAQFVGFKWTSSKASGLQSIVWRKEWEECYDEKYKNELLIYNEEDCKALCIVKDYILTIIKTNDSVKPEDLVNKQFTFNFLAGRYSLPEIEEVHKHSSFDYQREHVFVKSKKSSKKSKPKKTKWRKYPYNTVSEKKSLKCTQCKSPAYPSKTNLKKKVLDLQFKSTGIKRWVIQYKTSKYYCSNCKVLYIPQSYLDIKYKHGHNLMCYAIHQNIVNNESFRQISNNLKEFFDLEVGPTTLNDFKIRFSKYYHTAFKSLEKKVLSSEIIYVDETPIHMRDEKGYIWVLSNGYDVICYYQTNREAQFIRDLLKNFHGILVSDFFSAYDGIDCIHQKCLLHLIRDLNDDLIHYPFNEELKSITRSFSTIMQNIVRTIDKKGLKEKYLSKHISETTKFNESLNLSDFKSEIAIKYQKRFKKYSDSLFTFLHYDNLSWNNNTAEFAIKKLALHRNNNQLYFRKSRINDYLVAMSIFITCSFHDISFLKFLISKDKVIKAHNNKYT